MTKRLILASLAAALGLTFFSASPAGASETVGSCVVEELEKVGVENAEAIIVAGLADDASDEAKDTLTELEDDFDSCLEAPSPIVPEINEVIWGFGAFLVLLGFMIWKGFPGVNKIMMARTEKIEGDLEAADQAKVDALEVKARYEADLANAKAEGAQIIEEARQQAATVRAELQARAEADIAEMRARGAADAVAARSRAIADLQAEVSDIVVGAAERVVEANLDRDAQVQLIENYINQVGSR